MQAEATVSSGPEGKVASAGALATALFSAPCFISLLLFPIGITVGMSSALYVFADKYRFVFMAISLVTLGLTHWALRRGSHFKPTKTVWVLTVIVLVFIVGELVADPPWARHSIVDRLMHGSM